MTIVAMLCGASLATAEPMPYRGVDISSWPEVRENGGIVRSPSGRPVDLVRSIKQAGGTLVRLKLWNQPTSGYNNLARVTSLAREAKNAGLKILLDFHYSDTWADPGSQTTPLAWQALSFPSLVEAVRDFSRQSVLTLAAAGATPDLIQVGNEIPNGLLWPRGQLYGGDNSWTQFTDLLKAGIAGSREAAPGAQILIHIDKGADHGASVWFYDRMALYSVPYDMIGLSYYPWWHGPLANFKSNVTNLTTRYSKPILLVETAYPWTMDLTGRPWQHVKGDPSGLILGMPPTPQGQERFLTSVRKIMEDLPHKRGAGVVYWEPAWLTTPTLQSPWDNLNLFDYEGQELPGFRSLLSP